jgi:hypothetical protein
MYGIQFHSAALSMIQTYIHSQSRVDIGSSKFVDSSVAFSRIDIDNSSLLARGNRFEKGDVYLSGINVGKDGRVALSGGHRAQNETTFDATNIHLNDVSVTDGFLGIRDQYFVHTPLSWTGLKVSGGELIITHSERDADSPVSFENSSQRNGGYLTVDTVAENNTVDTRGLEISGKDKIRVIARSEIPADPEGTEDRPQAVPSAQHRRRVRSVEPVGSVEPVQSVQPVEPVPSSAEPAAGGWSNPRTELAYRQDDQPQPPSKPWY